MNLNKLLVNYRTPDLHDVHSVQKKTPTFVFLHDS